MTCAAERLWRSIEIRPIDDVSPAVEDYLRELRRVNVNGGAADARFDVRGNRGFDWFATRKRWDEIAFFSRLLAYARNHTAERQYRWADLDGGSFSGREQQ